MSQKKSNVLHKEKIVNTGDKGYTFNMLSDKESQAEIYAVKHNFSSETFVEINNTLKADHTSGF